MNNKKILERLEAWRPRLIINQPWYVEDEDAYQYIENLLREQIKHETQEPL